MTRPVAGAPRRAHAPESAPGGTLNIRVEANTLTDRALLLKRELKTTFWSGSSLDKNEFYQTSRNNNPCQVEDTFQMRTQTDYG